MKMRQIRFVCFLLIFGVFFATQTTSADILGQPETFFVNKKFDRDGRTALQATLRHISDKIYFYVSDSYWSTLSFSDRDKLTQNIIKLADNFENDIYPKEVQLWGSEPNPGVDGDTRITILMEELKEGNGGYFDSSNVYSKLDVNNSNEREMLSINVDILLSHPDLIMSFLAHEFHHLISTNQKELMRQVTEETWLNELRAEYAISYVGYNDSFIGSSLDRRSQAFVRNPSDSLVEWPNSTNDYAIAAMFAEYLVEQFGPNILGDTLRTSLTGINSLERYLTDNGHGVDFDDVFMNWMTAVYYNNASVDKRWGYVRPGLSTVNVVAQNRASLFNNFSSYTFVPYIKDWQPVWSEFTLGFGNTSRGLKLDVTGDGSHNFQVAYMAFYDTGFPVFGRIPVISGIGTAQITASSRGLNKVVVFTTKAAKKIGFSENELSSSLAIKGTVTGSGLVLQDIVLKESILKDGALIRRKNEPEIYVIWGKYKRYLAPGVISLYGHLNSVTAIELEPEIFNSYQSSNYVKYVNDEKVYAVWPDETKHWLNITPQHWDSTGRDWGAIFTINDLELNYYITGEEIIR